MVVEIVLQRFLIGMHCAKPLSSLKNGSE